MRATLPTGQGGVVHLFVVYGYQGSEDADKLLLTDRLLQAVLAEAQVVRVGQPLFVVGDFNAHPRVIPCLAKGISAGRFVDLALAHALGAEKERDATCRFKPQCICCFGCLPGPSIFGLPARLILQIGLPPSLPKLSRIFWDTTRKDLGVFPPELIQTLGAACDRESADDFWDAWSNGAESSLFQAYCGAGSPVAPGSHALLGRCRLRTRGRRLGGGAVGGSGASGRL